MQIERRILGNHSGRGVHKPIAICLHITAGSKGSVINTFQNLDNQVSSTFLCCRDGSIVQFVEITNRPKTNGIINKPTSALVKQMGGTNPNFYTVSIECEGYDGNGVDGTLTEVQFYSLCWLIKYIQTEVQRIYNVRIALNSHQIIGHREIDSVKKSQCPGKNFPFPRLFAELAIAESMDLTQSYEERLSSLQDTTSSATRAFNIATRIDQLNTRLSDPKWGEAAALKLAWLYPVVPDAKASTDVVNAVMGWYKDKKYDQVLTIESVMKERGLL